MLLIHARTFEQLQVNPPQLSQYCGDICTTLIGQHLITQLSLEALYVFMIDLVLGFVVILLGRLLFTFEHHLEVLGLNR